MPHNFFGTWTKGVQGGNPSMIGAGTDTQNDYAVFKCPPTGRRVAWLCSSKPNSKNVSTWSGHTSTADQSTSGVNHVKTRGNHIGPNDHHIIRLQENQAAVDQSTNGYGLHIGAIIVVNDR